MKTTEEWRLKLSPWSANKPVLDYLKAGANPKEVYGFVYEIWDHETRRSYIGKKFLWRKTKKKVNGKLKSVLEISDWETYCGSNDGILAAAQDHPESITRNIVRLCASKAECAYFETKLIFSYDAILDPKFHNNWVSCKITRPHMKKFAEKEVYFPLKNW